MQMDVGRETGLNGAEIGKRSAWLFKYVEAIRRSQVGSPCKCVCVSIFCSCVCLCVTGSTCACVSRLRWIENSADGHLEQICTLQQNTHMHA